MSRAKQRADRIRSDVPIVRVLSDYGYNVSPEGGDREQQFSCDLHGDGSDSKPSARVYPSSNSWFCFACSRPRDAIQTCREKEGLDFWSAIKALERRYHLPEMPWEDDIGGVEVALQDKVREILKAGMTRGDVIAQVKRRLEIATNEREMPMGVILKGWEDFDRVVHGFEHEGWSDARGFPIILAIFAPSTDLHE